MAPRLDTEHLTLDLSVADLLDARLLRHLGFANRGGYERMWLGQAIHSRYQENALAEDPTYRREVALVARFEHRGWQVRLQGRADGVRRDPDGATVVEEIKSVRRDGQLAPAVRELYQRQAALYAWMLQRIAATEEGAKTIDPGEEPPTIRAELVLIEIGSDAVERLPVEMDFRALDLVIQRRLNGILRVHREQEDARQQRRSAAAALAFPFKDVRPGQQQIFDAVTTALEQGEHLLLEAPTGLGKTVASLYPTLRYCLAHDKRLFVLTAKTLQQDMAMAVLELLNQTDAFHSLRLKAKAKMCANDQVVCHEEYCEFARDYYQKVQSSAVIPELLHRGTTLEPDVVYAAAQRAQVCPFEVSLELSGRVQVTVCDYNYAFDPYVSLTDFARDADLGDTVLVVDEIHNLLSRGRGYYSPELGAEPARQAAEIMARLGQAPGFEIADLCQELARIIEETAEDVLPRMGHPAGSWDEQAVEAALPEDSLWALRPAMDAAFIDYLEYQKETRSFRDDDPFVRLYFDFLRFLNGIVLSHSDTFSHCIERRRDGDWLRVLCKDPSRYLGEVINRCHGVIGLSATLSPPDLYRDLLGFEAARTATLSLPSPFPAENRRIVIDAAVATTYRERPANYPRIAERLAAFGEQVPGNCLALFPSYQFLAEVSGRMPVGSKRILVQQRADGDREREEILHTLRSAVLGDVLLLAVAGGVFAEGVDYPGDVLKAVAVVGPCLPALTLEQQLLRSYYDERFDRGFEYAFIVPGMTRVVQAAGRLIRSADDTGVIALFDRRFLQTQYRRHLPGHWVPEEGIKELVGDPSRVAAQFFAKPSSKSVVEL
jgi:DNA excision repair protein ERCC-2